MSNNIQWPQLGGGGGGAVDSVNGQTGVVVLNKSDIGLGSVDNKSLTAQNLAEKDPTGFPNRTDSGITFDDFTRTLFISAIGASFDVWVKGTQFTFPNLIAIGKQIPPTTGLWWFYFNNLGSLEVTNSFSSSLFTDNAIVAVVYWNQSAGTHTYFGDERHGLMDVDTHSYLHTVFGARYISGLALQGFVPDGSGNFDVNAQLSSDIGQIRDEDLVHSISGQSQFPVLYRVGDDWYKKTADNYAVIYNGTAGYTGTTIAYNQYVAPNWQLTPVTDNNFVCMHFFATNDVDAGVVAILGTTQYANAPQARAGAETEINSISGLPFAEFTAIGTVIFQTSSAYTNTPKAKVVSSNPTIGEVYIDFRGEQLYTPSGVASSHSLLSNLGADDHLQYHNDIRGDARYLQLTGGSLTGDVNTTGDIGIGVTLPVAPLQVSTVNKIVSPTMYTSDYIVISAEDTSPGFNIITAGNVAGNRGVYKSTRSRGALDAPTAVQNGDQTFSLVGAGHDGTTNITTAGITFSVDGAVATNQVPQAITFATGNGATRTERMRINSTGQVGINFQPSSTSAPLTVKSTAVPSTAETIASFFVTDSSANLNIGNASTVDGTFVPSLGFTQATGNTSSASMYQGFITLSDDTGTEPVHVFRGQTQNAGVFAPVAVRPLYQWRNWSTNLMTMLASGNLGLGTTTPAEKLDVVGNVNVSGSVIASNIPYIPPVYGSEASARAVFSTSTLSNYGGMTNGNSGTNALAVYDSSTPIGRIPHVTYTTTSTSGSTTGHRLTASFYALGTGARWKTTFQVDDATTVANARHFCGVNTSSTATAINTSVNNNPLMNSLTNFFAFASDAGAGDTNFCIYHNAGTAGATTRIDLGASFPNTNTGEIYHVTFYNPQGSLEVYYEVVAVNAQQKASGLITGNLPTTALLYLHCERFNAGSSSVVKFQGGSLLSWVL